MILCQDWCVTPISKVSGPGMQPEYEMKILPASSRVEICQLNAVLFFTTLQTFWSKKQVSGVGRSIIGGRIYSYIRIIKSPPIMNLPTPLKQVTQRITLQHERTYHFVVRLVLHLTKMADIRCHVQSVIICHSLKIIGISYQSNKVSNKESWARNCCQQY